MDVLFRLGSLEADFERICFYECDLFGSLLGKPDRRLERQDQKGSKPSKDMISSKVSGQ